MYRLILLDLDGTLLRSDHTVSALSRETLRRCREAGALIGFCTARSEINARYFTDDLRPDILISSGGALARMGGRTLYMCSFTAQETAALIAAGFRETDGECEVTVDALGAYYWNYRTDPNAAYGDWGETTYTDYVDFDVPGLKVCVTLPDPERAARVAACVGDCDHFKFGGSDWYKFTRAGATKGRAISELGAQLGIACADMIAFGDDYGDEDMLEVCGCGVAMGNAVDKVKAAADRIADTNDNDGAAQLLLSLLDAGLIGGAQGEDGHE